MEQQETYHMEHIYVFLGHVTWQPDLWRSAHGDAAFCQNSLTSCSVWHTSKVIIIITIVISFTIVPRASRSAVAVHGKCRPIRLLSRAVSMHPPLSCRAGQLILSPHTRWMPTTCHLTFGPPDTCPSPNNNHRGHLPPGLCKGRYGLMSAIVIFRGHVSEERTNAQHALYKTPLAILTV